MELLQYGNRWYSFKHVDWLRLPHSWHTWKVRHFYVVIRQRCDCVFSPDCPEGVISWGNIWVGHDLHWIYWLWNCWLLLRTSQGLVGNLQHGSLWLWVNSDPSNIRWYNMMQQLFDRVDPHQAHQRGKAAPYSYFCLSCHPFCHLLSAVPHHLAGSKWDESLTCVGFYIQTRAHGPGVACQGKPTDIRSLQPMDDMSTHTKREKERERETSITRSILHLLTDNVWISLPGYTMSLSIIVFRSHTLSLLNSSSVSHKVIAFFSPVKQMTTTFTTIFVLLDFFWVENSK